MEVAQEEERVCAQVVQAVWDYEPAQARILVAAAREDEQMRVQVRIQQIQAVER